jgi:hypothetical protein
MMCYTSVKDIYEYDIKMHMVEIYYDAPGSHYFNFKVENHLFTLFTGLDLVAIRVGRGIALSLDSIEVVIDGLLSIVLTNSVPQMDQPKKSAIEIIQSSPHTAHAVAWDRSYRAVDIYDSGYDMQHSHWMEVTPIHMA